MKSSSMTKIRPMPRRARRWASELSVPPRPSLPTLAREVVDFSPEQQGLRLKIVLRPEVSVTNFEPMQITRRHKIGSFASFQICARYSSVLTKRRQSVRRSKPCSNCCRARAPEPRNSKHVSSADRERIEQLMNFPERTWPSRGTHPARMPPPPDLLARRAPESHDVCLPACRVRRLHVVRSFTLPSPLFFTAGASHGGL